MKQTRLLKFAIIAAIILVAAFLMQKIGVSELRELIGEHVLFAPMIYVLCFAILPIFLFPVPILAVVAGAAFGLFAGSLYTIIGAMINSVLMFYIARFLGFRAVSDFTQNSKSKILKTLGEPGGKFSLILILRLMPLVPYNALNYACGVMNVSLRDYVVATFVGIVPATFIMVNLGEKALNMRSNGFIIACVLMAALVVLSSWGAKKIRAKRGDLGNNADL
ncbi:TVP38/TMEM64 family protein [Campylobacter concisus]|uniref:TVP38/TMEM64 family membrane protein n=1 Tax=Campylobacter concisus TaxID=199 RepID=A0A7S9WW43_9BACT|nr:TVP38/TMEM64 family protein [Campylobacter concisus]QPH95389.1 TVP38/TMEM64 family protein [Campylobacter concisus]